MLVVRGGDDNCRAKVTDRRLILSVLCHLNTGTCLALNGRGDVSVEVAGSSKD